MSKKEVEFDELYPLPDGWSWIALEDLLENPKQDAVDGPFGSNLKASEYVDEGVPIARLQNVGRNSFVHKNIRFVTTKKASDLARHHFLPGDILITKLGAPLGKACIAPNDIEQGIIVADLVRVRPDDKQIDRQYLTYAINSPFLVRQFERHTKGTTRPRVNLAVIRRLPIPVAPIDQQNTIVAEIEKRFSHLDEAVANLKRVKANLKRYKASVLQAAVEGKLTEEWRKANPDVEPASKLLDRILAERRAKWEEAELAKMEGKGKAPKNDKWKAKYKEPAAPETTNLPKLPEGWVTASLEQLTSSDRVICYGILMPKENLPDGVLYVKVKDMRGDKVNVACLQRTSPEIAAKYARASLRAGDLLLSIRGTYGRVAEVPPELDGGNITQDTARLATSRLLNTSYIAWFLRSQDAQNYFKRVARGVAVKGVNIAEVRTCPVFLPSPDEQCRIRSEVDGRLSVIRETESEVDANLLRAERLRQSVLTSAFSGGLQQAGRVPQSSSEPLGATTRQHEHAHGDTL